MQCYRYVIVVEGKRMVNPMFISSLALTSKPTMQLKIAQGLHTEMEPAQKGQLDKNHIPGNA